MGQIKISKKIYSKFKLSINVPQLFNNIELNLQIQKTKIKIRKNLSKNSPLIKRKQYRKKLENLMIKI